MAAAHERRRERARWLRWAPWLVGAAALAAVITAARHFADDRAFVDLLRRAEAAWLVAAVAIQLGTYAMQAQIWRGTARACGTVIRFRTAYALSLAKLFVDHALPSAGISGTIVYTRALERRGMTRKAVMTGVLVDAISWNATYALSLSAALLVIAAAGHARAAIVVVAAAFVSFALLLGATLLFSAGHPPHRLLRTLATRFAFVRAVLFLIEDVDGPLVRSPRLLSAATLYHVIILLFHTATLWVLLASIGVYAPPTAVFASFMTSSVMRTLGLLPGGLGTFEATSVLALTTLAGVPVAEALSATLAFRVLSFWLPMLPGLYFSRSAAFGSGSGGHGSEAARTVTT